MVIEEARQPVPDHQVGDRLVRLLVLRCGQRCGRPCPLQPATISLRKSCKMKPSVRGCAGSELGSSFPLSRRLNRLKERVPLASSAI